MFTVKVVDIEQKPVEFATVAAIGSNLGDITDKDGVAKINGYLGGGIRISCVGYKTFETDPNNGSTIELERSVFGLKEVAVKAKRIVVAGAKKNVGFILLFSLLLLIISFNQSQNSNGR